MPKISQLTILPLDLKASIYAIQGLCTKSRRCEDLSVLPLCSLRLCGEFCYGFHNHRDAENTEVTQRKTIRGVFVQDEHGSSLGTGSREVCELLLFIINKHASKLAPNNLLATAVDPEFLPNVNIQSAITI
jgi:hypothetical protein